MAISFKDFELPAKETYNFDRMLGALERTHHPELGRRTLLVAGTNGKGSVCHLLAEFLSAAGLRVGLYTSPHLISRTERIRVQGICISEEELLQLEQKHFEILEPLSFFERLSLLAWIYFREQKVDVQVLEVGMGGRLDATNLSEPDLSIITRISIDHAEVLGDRLELIAKEKAGILRPYRPVFSSPQDDEVQRVLKQEAIRRDSKWIEPSSTHFSPILEAALNERSAQFGHHQEENARVSLSVFQYLSKEWNLSAREPEIARLIETAQLSGRIEKKLSMGGGTWILDGGHNHNALLALGHFLRDRENLRNDFHLVFGAMREKNYSEMIEILNPFVSSVDLPWFYPVRQAAPEILMPFFKGLKVQTLGEHAFEERIRDLWMTNQNVLIAGSFYLVGAVLRGLEK